MDFLTFNAGPSPHHFWTILEAFGCNEMAAPMSRPNDDCLRTMSSRFEPRSATALQLSAPTSIRSPALGTYRSRNPNTSPYDNYAKWFAIVYDTEDLIVSFDSVNFSFPDRIDLPENKPSAHQRSRTSAVRTLLTTLVLHCARYSCGAHAKPFAQMLKPWSTKAPKMGPHCTYALCAYGAGMHISWYHLRYARILRLSWYVDVFACVFVFP